MIKPEKDMENVARGDEKLSKEERRDKLMFEGQQESQPVHPSTVRPSLCPTRRLQIWKPRNLQLQESGNQEY